MPIPKTYFMAFTKKSSSETNYDSIESLFRDIRTKKIAALYSHQSETIKIYEQKFFNEENIALELPTGSGKTLIGLLIGEYLRRTKNQKIVFLCSTNQLVNQVVDQANNKYSIKATAFTGEKSKYNASDKADYQTAKTIAVTNYSSLFNINPFFKDPDIIIFDDAHVAENYIASNWSLNIDRNNEHQTQIYIGLLSIIQSSLEYSEYVRLMDDDPDPLTKNTVQLIPIQVLYTLKDKIYDYLKSNLDIENKHHKNLYFTWQKLQLHFLSCQFYISWKSILIRPIIPPTFTLPAFEKAKQKIFMSATLGAGGDLERILGLKKIVRIPLPTGWDKQGSGRRFFVFPEMSMNKEEQTKLYIETNKLFDRSLTLLPDSKRLNDFSKIAKELLGYNVFDVQSLEQSKKDFVNTKKAVALVANRYEGIDFEDDECRLLFVVNLPKTVNLQETFLFQRMGSMVVLHDRIRTRIIQAIGRCTRGSSDYSCVIVMGEDISEYFISRNFRKYFHPELQAEISFGIAQSQNGNIENILENIKIFNEQGNDWQEVEKDIFDERDQSVQDNIPGFSELAKSSEFEVDFQHCLWNQDYKSAVVAAQNVINNLSGKKDLDGYRGFWNYLASVASFLASKEYNMIEFTDKTNQFLVNASNCSKSIPWLRKLSQLNFANAEVINNWDDELASNIERLDVVFTDVGVSSTTRFEKELKEIQEGLFHNDATKFEQAQLSLGKYLGFESIKDKRQGAPDPIWISNDKLCIVFEDHTDKTNDTISISKARQAKAHKDWVNTNLSNAQSMDIYCVIVTSANTINKEAISFSKDVFYWQLEDFRNWANGAILTIRSCRTSYISGSAMWREMAMEAFVKAKVDPKSVIERATRISLDTIPVS